MGGPSGHLIAQEGSQILILVRGDVIDPGVDRRSPTQIHGRARTEVITAEPAVATQFSGCGSIKRVETDPKTLFVCIAHELRQAFHLLGCPRTRLCRTTS